MAGIISSLKQLQRGAIMGLGGLKTFPLLKLRLELVFYIDFRAVFAPSRGRGF